MLAISTLQLAIHMCSHFLFDFCHVKCVLWIWKSWETMIEWTNASTPDDKELGTPTCQNGLCACATSAATPTSCKIVLPINRQSFTLWIQLEMLKCLRCDFLPSMVRRVYWLWCQCNALLFFRLPWRFLLRQQDCDALHAAISVPAPMAAEPD